MPTAFEDREVQCAARASAHGQGGMFSKSSYSTHLGLQNFVLTLPTGQEIPEVLSPRSSLETFEACIMVSRPYAT